MQAEEEEVLVSEPLLTAPQQTCVVPGFSQIQVQHASSFYMRYLFHKVQGMCALISTIRLIVLSLLHCLSDYAKDPLRYSRYKMVVFLFWCV